LTSDCRVDPGEITEEHLRGVIVFEEVEAFALSIEDGQALDIVEDQAGEIGVGTRQLFLTLRRVQLQLIDGVFEDFGRAFNIVLQHESAAEHIVRLEGVAADSLAQLVQQADDLVKVRLHPALVDLQKLGGHGMVRYEMTRSLKWQTRLDLPESTSA